ncbi:MAG: hypothetical protein ACKVVT_05875 [Dehalococcoidia bacterium]
MERLQVGLQGEEYAALRCESERLGVSMSEVVRRAIRPLVSVSAAAVPADDRQLSDQDPLFQIVGIADGAYCGDPSRASDDIDAVVYAGPKSGNDPLFQIIGIGGHIPGDSGSDLDAVVYGAVPQR